MYLKFPCAVLISDSENTDSESMFDANYFFTFDVNYLDIDLAYHILLFKYVISVSYQIWYYISYVFHTVCFMFYGHRISSGMLGHTNHFF